MIKKGGMAVEEQLERVLVPVLLGDGAQALATARTLYLHYHVISHMYCVRPSFFSYLISYLRVVRVPAYMQGDLLCSDLLTFSQQYPDLLFCLIPCTEPYKAFCMAHAKELEPHYVIMQPEQLKKGTLPYLTKEEMPI